MKTLTVTVPCWRVWGWGRGRWTLRSTHATHAEAAETAEFLHHRHRIRTKVRQGTHRVASYVEAPAPTAAQRFREQQSDQMVLRRQAHAYFKSGCNGTEILQPAKEAGA